MKKDRKEKKKKKASDSLHAPLQSLPILIPSLSLSFVQQREGYIQTEHWKKGM